MAIQRKVMSRKLCIVCAEYVAANQFPKLPHKQDGATEHSSDTCFKCFRQHLINEIKFKGYDTVACPQCSKPLDQSEIRKLVPSFSYQKYLDKAAMQCMQQDEEYHTCPKAGCPWGALFVKGDGNILVCGKCAARYCIDCEVPFHEGQTCGQYQAMRQVEQEQSTLITIQQTTQPCPRCHVHIEENEGCDHMTCTQCNYQFCYVCLAPYQGIDGITDMGNDVHDEACPWAAHNLPALAEQHNQMFYHNHEEVERPEAEAEPLPRADVQPIADGSWFGEMGDIWDNTMSQ